MTDEVIVYIAAPVTARGGWRVRSQNRQICELSQEEDAVIYAAEHARKIEAAGGSVVVKIERSDGSWASFPV